ncbi:MAG TPA: ABC transporter permease [Mycobacteriales bacterium]|nr:ABC transporter permease [Mycobacteriales bacterium]
MKLPALSLPALPRPALPRWAQRVLLLVGWALGVVVAVEVAFGRRTTSDVLGVPVPHGVPSGVLVNGAVLGMLYALLAFGLILVYRANRIVNFAHAGLGLVPAVTALLLVTNHQWPYVPSLLVMLVGSALVGGLVELVMRRFWSQPRLIATVFTIGLAQIFVFLELKLPGWIAGRPSLPTSFPTPYARFKTDIGGVIFSGDYLAIVVAAAAVCGGLAAFLRYTRAGIAVRASAENADRAALLGVPVARLSTIVWVLAGLCSGVAVFLQAPVTALPTGGAVSPLVLLYGLAAAVVARMESLPVAFVAGMGIGVIQQGAFSGSSKPDDAAALMLPVILGALLFQRKRMARAFDTGVTSFRALQEFRPVPVEMRDLLAVRRARAGAVAGLVVLGVAGPFLVGTSRVGFCTDALLAGMVAVSLVVLSGWAGQISLGQSAFAGIGAAVAGGLATRHGTDFFVTLATALVVGAVLAVLIGVPAVRVPGLFLSVVTLGLAASVQYGILSRAHFSWLLPPTGSYVTKPLLYGRFDLSKSGLGYYYLCLVFLVLAWLSAWSVRRSRSGRLFIGLRDNERAAQSYGANATSTRLAAFAISGAIAALAGALSAYQSQVDPGSFSMDISLTAFLYAVVGGLTSLPGAVLASIAFSALSFAGGANLSVLASGVGVSIVLLVFPGGLAQAAQRTRDGALRWLAERHDLHVPSLVADSRRADDGDGADDEVLRAAAQHVQQVGSLAGSRP